ncbi:MAG: SMC-Scp complex subunit ScpB [Xanthomonadaceae bacterium]|jgi:segregation and condensation protein B|nr:SMC-Scp complex subunit ScpB [Xanthomonadaceae bacterium]
MDQLFINRIVEAALLAANQPLSLPQLYGLFPEEQPAPNDSIEMAIARLQQDCAERGIELVEIASGFRYQIRTEVHPWISRLWTERQTKYTRATLETLALIAYRQPITRGEIEQVRGVAVSSNIIKALEEREWIRVIGHRDVPGKPALYGTTKTFLDYFGLKRLDELPPLSELKDIDELEPELPLGIDKPVPVSGIPVSLTDTQNGTDSDNLEEAQETESSPIQGEAGAAASQHHQTEEEHSDPQEQNPSDGITGKIDLNAASASTITEFIDTTITARTTDTADEETPAESKIPGQSHSHE